MHTLFETSFSIRNARYPIDVDAIHVAESNVIRLGQWPSDTAPTLADVCPFIVASVEMRAWLVGARGYGRVQVGSLAPLSAIAARIDEWCDAE